MSVSGKKGASPVASEQTSLANPITFYKSKTGEYPSNSQIWWAYKRPPELGTDDPPKQYLEVFDPGIRHQIYTGNTPTPKGHFILDAFKLDRSGVSGVGGLSVDSSGGRRPRATSFFAGRVFYAGVLHPGFNTRVYFSQILESPAQVGECYQLADPTSEDIRDLLPSDGGVIVIPEVEQIYHMVPMGMSLLIFASNGVWSINGSDGVGFTANNYSVIKISGDPTVSNQNFVLVDGVPIWWNKSDINTISTEGGLSVQSLTDETIQSFFEEIPEQSKVYAKGAYDPLTKKVQWLYRSTETSDETQLFNYDRLLMLDTRTGSFSPWSLSVVNRVEVYGIFAAKGYSTSQSQETVIVGIDTVQASSEDVYVLRTNRELVQSKIKYIVNVLDDDEGAEDPGDAEELATLEVFVGADRVVVSTDEVIVSP